MVVDDEPIARKIVINYIERMPQLRMTIEQINALSAIDYLKSNNNIDIIFLDITMPNLSGIELLKIIQPRQPVILTTAYTEYAVESYELNAVDYLLKPFSFERFTKAVYKAIDLVKKTPIAGEVMKEKKRVIFIKSDGKNYPVELDDILYCEAMKNYTMVMLRSEKKLMPLIPLSKFEDVLAEAGGDFIQVHRSFIISRKYITSVSANIVNIAKYTIPIGVQYKDSFFRRIGYPS